MSARLRTSESVVAHIGRDPGASGLRRSTDNALSSLPDGALSRRFCAWRGASDRRYVASVYPVDRASRDAGLPAFEGFVLMAVACGPLGRRILAASAVERSGDLDAARALGLARGAQEWHVHFLAEDRYERSAMVADLLGRHGDETEARCA